MKLKDPVDKENVVGPVYKIKCEECDVVYVDDIERFLKSRFREHQQPSSTTLEVSKRIHVDHPQHSVELENTEVLITELRGFESGVKEAIYIRAFNPGPSTQASTEMEGDTIYHLYGRTSSRRK